MELFLFEQIRKVCELFGKSSVNYNKDDIKYIDINVGIIF